MTPQEAVDVLISDGLLVSVSHTAPKLRQLITECVTTATAEEMRRCAAVVIDAHKGGDAIDKKFGKWLANAILITGGLKVEE